MKKLILFIIALMIVFASCEKEDETSTNESSDKKLVELKVTLSYNWFYSDKDDVEKEIRQLFINEMSHLELAVIPFFDVENRNIVNLPIDLCLCATGSNGI